MSVCLDPRSSPKAHRLITPGLFSGDWEGYFAVRNTLVVLTRVRLFFTLTHYFSLFDITLVHHFSPGFSVH